MCGISGKLYFYFNHPVDRELIQRMNAVLQHRGPDDAGIWCEGPIGLGHTRLAIIDLSPAGHQPMSNESGEIWFSFNGEIYNHLEIKDELEQRGHYFHSRSDTEVIIHLYEEYVGEVDGIHSSRRLPEWVSRLSGMFAFALWDGRRKRLVLARDRFGKKPLYYAATPEGIIFGSEIKALLQDETVSTDMDEASLHYYFTYGYVPAPRTIFRAIHKLPPACILIAEEGHLSIERYWRLNYLPKLAISEQEASEQLLDLLRSATKMRLVSDVPIGAFLSGGLDSSAVVALMAQCQNNPIKTFSIGFDEPSFDELKYARQVVNRYATDHHEFRITPDALAALPELVWAYGEPYADSSALPSYYLARETRQYVTVALNGDGGDEAFAGYDRYLATRLAEKYHLLPLWLRKGIIAPAAQRLPESAQRKDAFCRLKRFVTALEDSPERRYRCWVGLMDNAEMYRLYTPEFSAQVAEVDSFTLLGKYYAEADSPDFVERTQFVDVHTYLPDDLLVKIDIATMMHSLEARSPFLDHRVAEFAARLPVAYKLRGRTSKYLLRKAMRDYLPESILRRGKQGFGIPVGRWFRNQLQTFTRELLLDSITLSRGILNRNGLRCLLEEHFSSRVDHGQHIWQMIFLELWFRTYIDRPRTALTGPLENIPLKESSKADALVA